MIVFKTAATLTPFISQHKKSGSLVGFVPTMGALHEGHLSLIRASKKENALTVCSIFINPTQFNNSDDFKNYPVTIEQDLEKLLSVGCDAVFLPSRDEIYPSDFNARNYELGELENILEGKFRPGHFQGVCQVVDRLLAMVQPDNLYLGAKDYQQCKVISRLISLIDKQGEISIHIEPTYREEDGLAMSSRNLRLTPAQRLLAPSIFEALTFIKTNLEHRNLEQLQEQAALMLSEKGFKVDYLQVVDADTLKPATDKTKDRVAVVAAYIGTIRLIDNLSLN